MAASTTIPADPHGHGHGHGHGATGPTTGPTTAGEGKVLGVLAEFTDADGLMSACRKVRDAGYKEWDTFTPLPVHGIEDAMGVKPTILPYLVASGGATGTLTAFLLQWFTNAYDYPIVVSGKPNVGPYNIVVCFELTILFGSITAFLGQLLLNGLPRFYHPLFSHARFRRATSDRFFLAIESEDPKFDRERTADLLRATPATSVEVFREPEAGNEANSQIPSLLVTLGVILGLVAVLPPILIWGMRVGTRETTGANRQIDKGMFWQFKAPTQGSNVLFADGKTMRPPVEGTVPVEAKVGKSHLTTGKLADVAAVRLSGLSGGAVAGAVADDYAATFPPEIGVPSVEDILGRGKDKYTIYCSGCHGLQGLGDGLVHKQAGNPENPGWVQPQNLASDYAADPKYPDGKIFDTITHGRNSMRGLGTQIPVEDRWYIVAYVRTLQKRTGTKADVPAEKLSTLR
jgi:mono/diheme cytochrome c family protein